MDPTAVTAATAATAATGTVATAAIQTQPQYLYFTLLLAALIGFLYLLVYGLGIANVSSNWAANRCKPQIMPFASLYGYNTADNFNYCMTNIIKDQAGNSLGPVYQILATFVGTLSTLLASANSLRLSLATLVGGITTVFQEFTERINALMVSIRVSSVRMKMLFGRLFATFYAMIYMGMSGITAVSNFGDTFLFKFLDTFCFDPTTLVDIEGKGEIPVRDVKIGDIFTKKGGKVTATFAFIADGQPMIKLGSTLVSTNHYVLTNISGKKYVQAKNHPDAAAAEPWQGGATKPLICFNTSDHHIPVADHVFLDYDETESANGPTMERLQRQMNGLQQTTSSDSTEYTKEYSPGFAEDTEICLPLNKYLPAKDIVLGQQLSTGKVIGIVKKEVFTVVIRHGETISASSLIWDTPTNQWKRGFDMGLVTHKRRKPQVIYCFIVSPTATIETRQGNHIRDYIEILSPDAENDYSNEIAA